MIYGRFGNVITIVRKAVLADVKPLTGRRPDKQDRDAIANGSYWVVKQYADRDDLDIHHLGFMRADGGLAEISERLRELDPDGDW